MTINVAKIIAKYFTTFVFGALILRLIYKNFLTKETIGLEDVLSFLIPAIILTVTLIGLFYLTDFLIEIKRLD